MTSKRNVAAAAISLTCCCRFIYDQKENIYPNTKLQDINQ
jgi:hypothetical protein